MNPNSNGPPGDPRGERRPASRASSSSLGSIKVGRVGQLVRQRSNYDFGVARIASMAGNLAETVRPSGERQQRSVTELELAVLAPSMLVTLADRPEQFQIEAVFYQPGQELRTLVVEGVTSAEAFEVTEDHVVDVHPAGDPTLRLLQLDHRGRHTLLAREGLLHAYSEAQGNCRGLENLAGARIDLLPHQLRAAQRVLSLPAPRALLGDEVGLGKTIECGMVLSVLFRQNPGLRVLVLCPGQLCLEWLGELYSRFHARVFALAEHALAAPAELPNQPRLIASFGLVQQSEPLQKVLVELPWDMVVVDEAHRLPAGSPLFAFVRELATRSPGLLLLSATPTPSRPAEYTRLVSLLDKSAAAAAKDAKDAGKLDKLRPFQQQLAALAVETEKAAPQALSALAPRWLELLGKDEQIQAFVADFARKPPKARAARASLLRHVAEWYGLDSRVIRSRRDHLGGDLKLPARTFTPLSYTPSEPESRVATLLSTWCEALSGGSASPRGLAIGRYLAAHALQLFASSSAALAWLVAERRKGLSAKESLSATLEGALDLPLSQPETRRLLTLACRQLPVQAQANEKALLQELDAAIQLWQKDEPRLTVLCRWIGAQLEKEPAGKMLVFVEEPETLQALQPLLATELTRRRLRVAGLHAGMAAKERERAAHNFTHSDTTAVLLCDQLGGEGRGFAAASWVIHADLPWDLGLIEQRIGRTEQLGRLGREQPVRILAISSPHFVERSVSELVWQHAGLGERSLAGLQFLAEELRRELVQQATTGREPPLTAWLATARTRIEGERLRGSEAQDPTPVFDRHRFDAEEAQELIDELVEDSRVSFPPLSDWAKKTGIVLKSTREPDVFDVDIGGQTRPVIELRPETLRCTIDRGLALGDPSLQFLTWGHPLIEALLHDASTYEAARCTHVVHEDLEGRTWRGCRVRVLVQANPAHLAGLPAALQGLVGYVAQRMEETVFVRADGEIEPVARQKEFLERAFSRSHNPDLLALAADERAYRQFASEVRTAAQAGLDHVKSKLVPIFTEPAGELAEDPDLLACRARLAVTDPRLADEPRRLAVDLAGFYEKALASIREPLVQIDNIAFLDVYPASGPAAKT